MCLRPLVSSIPAFLLMVVASCANREATHQRLTPEVIESRLTSAERHLVTARADSAGMLFAEVLRDSPACRRALLGKAQVALQEKDWDLASDLAKELLRTGPSDLMAHYVAGVAHRERGKELLPENPEWKASQREFEWILGRDSSFEDVLLQYVLLRRYEGNRHPALRLALEQVKKRPDLLKARVGLFKIFKYYLATDPTDSILALTREFPGDVSRYFAAEALRRKGDLPAAETLLTQLLNDHELIPVQAVRLSLARLRCKAGDRNGAESQYWMAVSELTTEFGAAILFEDLKYILSDVELSVYCGLQSVQEKQAFYRDFWNFRNPSLALGVNLRLQEHIRRSVVAEERYEYYGFRTRFNDPDRLHELKFPRAAALNEELNDMGLIYLRHGEPNDHVQTQTTFFDLWDELYNPTNRGKLRLSPPASSAREAKLILDERDARLAESLGLSSTDQDPCEAWLYNATGEFPKMIFLFQKHNSSGNNWRLSPKTNSEDLNSELLVWDVSYAQLFTSRELHRAPIQEQIKEASRTSVALALSNERQTWPARRAVTGFPHAIDMFRASDRRSLVDVSYALPLSPLAEVLPESTNVVPLEIGVAMVNAKGRSALARRDTMTLKLPTEPNSVIFDLFRCTVLPDSYAVSMYVRSLSGEMLRTWRQTVRVKDFARDGLTLSSLQLLRPSSAPSATIVHGVKVLQDPLREHTRSAPMYAYVQIYHLVRNDYGNTSYRIEYVLVPRSDSDRRIVVFKDEKGGREEMESEFCALDVHKVDTGAYRLIVRVTDRNRVETVEAEREVVIVK